MVVTHTLAIVMLMFLQSVVGNAQGIGLLQIVPTNDPATGITRCTINWVNNVSLDQIRGINVTASIGGVQVCLNNSTAAVVPSVIHPGFDVNPYQRQFTGAQFTLSRGGLPSSLLFSLPNPKPYSAPPNTSFLVLNFRALPASITTINVSGSIRLENGALALFAPVSLNWTVSSGALIAGDFVKPDGLGCDLGGGIGMGLLIPGVNTTKVAAVAPGACFPGVASEGAVFPGQYEFLNNPLYETYTITPSKVNTAWKLCKHYHHYRHHS